MTRKSKPPIAIYSALADATRCRIIEILLAGPIPVHKLADAFSISRPAISRHLRVLKTAGLVAEVKKGRENLYALRTRKLGPAMAWIDTVLTQPTSDEGAAALGDTATAPVIEETQTPVAPSVAPEPVTAIPVEAAPVMSTALAEPEAAKTKTKRAAKAERVVAPAPALNQMGFDF